MKVLRIAICEDNEEELEYLQTLLTDILGKYSVPYHITAYTSGEELLWSPLDYQLVFLDIMMDGENGIEIGKKIYRRRKDIKIIFQTHLGDFVGDAMNKSHAFAFLEKPLQRSLLEEQIQEIFGVKAHTKEICIEFRNVGCLNAGSAMEMGSLKLPVDSLLYFEYQKRGRTIKAVTKQGEFFCRETMHTLTERMKPFGFALCSRGILVNMEKIKKIKRYDVILCDDSVLPLSQRRAAAFKERLNEFVRDSFEGNYG